MSMTSGGRPGIGEVVLLGTAGGPVLDPHRLGPSQAVVTEHGWQLVDCGQGASHAAALAGLSLADLRGIWLTHLHSDHVADLFAVLAIGWARWNAPVTLGGPVGTRRLVDGLLDAYHLDLKWREQHSGRPPLRELLDVRELVSGDASHAAGARITAVEVEHPPVRPALGYRLDTDGGSVVVSGDTTPCDALIDLAHGADVLIHEAYHPDAIALVAERDTGARVLAHIAESHTSVRDVGAVAQSAGARTLAVSHLVPSSGVDEQTWEQEAQRGFDGRVLVGRDGLRIEMVGVAHRRGSTS